MKIKLHSVWNAVKSRKSVRALTSKSVLNTLIRKLKNAL